MATFNPVQLHITKFFLPFTFCFVFAKAKEGKTLLKALTVSDGQKSGWYQVLTLSESVEINGSQEVIVDFKDLNLDGDNDLYVSTRRGLTNTYHDYWVFEKTNFRFVYAGNHPFLQVDSNTGRLSAYERYGSGGLHYQKTIYQFIKGKLTFRNVEASDPPSSSSDFLTDGTDIFYLFSYRC